MALFGSFQRGENLPESDIDFLLDFLPDAEIGFLALSRMQLELSELLHHSVDLVPKAGLKPVIRRQLLAEARVIYAE